MVINDKRRRSRHRRRPANRDGYKTGLLLLLPAVFLAACSPGSHTSSDTASVPATAETAAATPLRRYADSGWGFRLNQPKGWKALPGFSRSYLANAQWKAFAGPDSHGTPIVSLVMPGSNRITDAEIRIGASRDPAALADCKKPPDAARSDNVRQRVIGDSDFTAFTASDAAMSHRLLVHGYRTLHEGACYAIDLMVYGTDPRVYDPPATPPFSDDEAFARMQEILASFRFTR